MGIYNVYILCALAHDVYALYVEKSYYILLVTVTGKYCQIIFSKNNLVFLRIFLWKRKLEVKSWYNKQAIEKVYSKIKQTHHFCGLILLVGMLGQC